MKRSETLGFGSFATKAAESPTTSSVGGCPPPFHGINPSAMQDWLRIHRRLVELETEFSEVAMRAAAGEISVDELQEKRNHLTAMRDLCSAIYEKAFGSARRP